MTGLSVATRLSEIVLYEFGQINGEGVLACRRTKSRFGAVFTRWLPDEGSRTAQAGKLARSSATFQLLLTLAPRELAVLRGFKQWFVHISAHSGQFARLVGEGSTTNRDRVWAEGPNRSVRVPRGTHNSGCVRPRHAKPRLRVARWSERATDRAEKHTQQRLCVPLGSKWPGTGPKTAQNSGCVQAGSPNGSSCSRKVHQTAVVCG